MRRNEDGLRFRRRKYPKIQEIFQKFVFQTKGPLVKGQQNYIPSASGRHKYTRVMTIEKRSKRSI